MQGPLANYRVKRKALGFFPSAFFFKTFKHQLCFFFTSYTNFFSALRINFFNLFTDSILNKAHNPLKKVIFKIAIMLFLKGITYYQIIYYCYLFNFRPEANSLVIFMII